MVGCGTALFVCGWCFHPDAEVQSLAILVDDDIQPVMADGMPRLDPFRALEDSPADPRHHSYRSGFWGLARIAGPRLAGTCRLALRAELDDGAVAVAELDSVDIEPTRRRVSPNGSAEAGASHIAICMATYNPPLDLLEHQLASIREQSHANWTCLISDDCSTPDHHRAILAATAGDARFVVSRSPRRLGFYGNFERALMMVPPESAFVALADQDDRWHRDKLETLVGAIGGAQLVYSDARVVGRGGELISDTWWSARRNNHSDLLSLLVANSVTGAASLMRRELLDYALPFPPAQFAHFHDHWLGLVALALGDVAFVDRPLYDYVQHGEASLGHTAANQIVSLRSRIRHQSAPRERVRMWRLHYYADVCRLMQFATIVKMRCEARMTPGKRRALNHFLDADRSPIALTRMGLRGAGELLSATPETLGAEWMLFWGLAWRRMLAASARERPQRLLRLDAIPPPTLTVRPRRSGADEQAGAIAAKVAPLRFVRSEHAPRRINLLIPTIDPDHFFGGYIAKFNLARRLSQGGATVRIVTVDPVGALPPDWRATVESYSGLRGLFDEIEVVFGREAAEIEISPTDGIVATTWWTAHVARAAMTLVESDRFVYLIQEYEPFTFPMGSYAALAAESYRFRHFALFSSELLRGYFRRHGIGVYAHGLAEGDHNCMAFENSITPVAAPRPDEARAPQPTPPPVLRQARAPRRPQHVRARGTRARAGARRRTVQDWLGAARDRYRQPGAADRPRGGCPP